jgi:hypothetical protein
MTALGSTRRLSHPLTTTQAPPPAAFTIVVPTHNERDDIAATLDAALAQTVPAEVIVVDGGSMDGTLEYLRGRREVTLIDERSRRGVAAARNEAMRAAAGEIVVFLNADVTLPQDFLERLARHYENGADAVSVESRVANTNDLTGRYIQAMHEVKYPAGRVGWTEAFSCRRVRALEAGFPEQIPGAGGEDVAFLDRLRANGCAWVVDYSLGVEHRVPSTLGAFAQQFRGRGRAVPYAEHRVQGRALATVALRRTAASILTLAGMITLVPNALAAYRLSRRSPRGFLDLPAFWLAHHVLLLSHRLGEWESVTALWRVRRSQA